MQVQKKIVDKEIHVVSMKCKEHLRIMTSSGSLYLLVYLYKLFVRMTIFSTGDEWD